MPDITTSLDYLLATVRPKSEDNMPCVIIIKLFFDMY